MKLTFNAILRLGSNAYGVTIQQTVEEVTGRSTSIGAIYTTLERLEQKRLVSSCQREPTLSAAGGQRNTSRSRAPARRRSIMSSECVMHYGLGCGQWEVRYE
jgi:hypothetical protein